MRVAAVDCGTNTIRLLVLDDAMPLLRISRIVRLGEGVDAAGRLAPGAVARMLAVLDDYAVMVRDSGVERVRLCATSAVRDATHPDDRAHLDDAVRARLGVGLDVLTGEEEATLTFAGAVRCLRVPGAEEVLVVDVGGGSTELVLGPHDRSRPPVGHSADVGAVRLTERLLRSDPPTPAELAAGAEQVDAALDEAQAAGVDLAAAGTRATVVGVAGTALTLAAGVIGAGTPEAADQAVVDAEALLATIADVAAMTTEQRVATGWIDPGRADVLPAGGLVLERVLRRTGARRMVASVGDVLDGIAHELLPGRTP